VRGAVNQSSELAFRFVSGHRALNLLATLGNRHRAPVERLRDPADLTRWFTAADLVVPGTASETDLDDARQLRETINRLTRALLADQAPQRGDLDALNRWARRPALAPQADADLQRHWIGDPAAPAALALIAREATELLTGPERALIRECAAAPNCSLLYLDRSRAGRRRWCEMDRCGSRAKMTSYRHRQNTPRSEPSEHVLSAPNTRPV
jgi:predicted RNA-binding Zn ribbon-like protein